MPATLQPAPAQHDRRSRHVRRTRLRLPSESARFSAVFSIEEALRLITLPHEDEGRLYFFRSLSVPALPEHANRRAWTEVFQAGLTTAAAAAIPGSHPSAPNASAVYFNSIDEALESLLHSALKNITATPPWFAASVLGLPAHPQPFGQAGQLLSAIVERLRPPAMPLAAGAAILISAIGLQDPALLFNVIPEESWRKWFKEQNSSNIYPSARPKQSITLSQSLNDLLQKVAAQFGWRSPAVKWLATMAVAATSPSLPESQLQACAQGTLRQLESSVAPHSIRDESTAPPQTFNRDFHSKPTPARPVSQTASPATKLPAFTDGLQTKKPDDDARAARPYPGQEAPQTPSDSADTLVPSRTETAADPPIKQTMLAEPTPSAGLYFLLHVLRHLGIAAALRETPDLAEADLPAHILRVLAASNGVLANDPILNPLGILKPFNLPAEILAQLPPSAFPNTQPGLCPDSATLLLHWVRAARLWCARNTRMTVRRILLRPGHVWLTRTDLDVTLPLAAADIRIRRAGLDLDPLWLPWLGPTGRVVRFHYISATESPGGAA